MLWGLTVKHSKTAEAHQHELHEMVICHSDTGTIDIDGSAYDFYPGRTLFIPGGTPHCIKASPAAPAKALFVCIAPSALAQHLPANAANLLNQLLSKSQAGEPDGQLREDVLSLSLKIEEVLESSSPLAQQLFSALFNQLIVLHCMSCKGDESNPRDDGQLRMGEVANWLNENYASDITVDALAAQANMSRSMFSRQFRKHMGMSLMEYCLRLRTNAAAALLTVSDLAVTQVAYTVGFSNLSHFHRIFKRHLNMSPGEYRKFLRAQGMSA